MFGVAAVGASPWSAAAQGPSPSRLGPDRLVLLGVRGGPLVTGYASPLTASLIVASGVPMLIDAGFGVTYRLLEAGATYPYSARWPRTAFMSCVR
jgi:hypothetical protein